ncbi:hypothetical protein BH09BAC1_BH09BAC1_06350 [soil metagenome]
MGNKYDNIIVEGLQAGGTSPVEAQIRLCEVLDVQRRPELLLVAERLVENAKLAEPQLRGQYFTARALANLGEHDRAQKMMIDVLDAAKEEVGALPVYIDCLTTLAGMALKQGDVSESLALATEAFNLSQDAEYTKGIATTCNHFGSLKLQQGDVEGALEYLDEALKQSKILRSEAINYPIYSNLGIAHMLLGHFAIALEYFNHTLTESQETGHQLGEALTSINIANLYTGQGNYARALEYVFAALNIYQDNADEQNTSYAMGMLGDIYKDLRQYTDAEQYYRQALQMSKQSGNLFGQATSYHHLGSVLALQDKYDQASESLLFAREICEKQGHNVLLAMIHLELGALYTLQERYQESWAALQTGKELAAVAGHKHLHCKFLQFSGKLEVARNKPEEALPYLLEGEELATQLGLQDDWSQLTLLLSECYEQLGATEKALAYHKLFHKKDRQLHGEGSAKHIASLELGHQLEQKTKEAEIERLKNIELKKAYDELKTAQDRLVQQEKLASLGHLVTGIAHELQNPLNFVTNFSALTVDLLEELNETEDEQERAEVTKDILENLKKIRAHSARASSIVTGMFEFKRDGACAAQAVKLSRILEDFVPLAWNSYRFKYPDLHVQIDIAPYDNTMEANVVVMDVGRALVSVLNNAFDALLDAQQLHGSFFTPTVKIGLVRDGDKAVLSITDNARGMTSEQVGLVFDPFYTTHPPGTGHIGLGLSIANDMIAAQGGSLQVESTRDLGTTMSMVLPSVKH